jgi:fluoroquinolone resistance protein
LDGRRIAVEETGAAQEHSGLNTISSGSAYDEQTFRDLRMDQERITSSRFSDCAFVHCSFAGCAFSDCRFVDCVFQYCDLGVARVPSSALSSVRFVDSKVVGVNWVDAKWTKKTASAISFERCVICRSTFFGLKLPALRVRECTAVDVDFREADLRGADLRGTDLSESLFSETNLAGADLRGARNYRISPARNVLTRTKFSMPEAMALLYCLDIVLADGETPPA